MQVPDEIQRKLSKLETQKYEQKKRLQSELDKYEQIKREIEQIERDLINKKQTKLF